MDPSQLQSDTDNDVHSLENESVNLDSSSTQDLNTPQPNPQPINNAQNSLEDQPMNNGALTPPPEKVRKEFILKRLWARTNLYLLIFLLLMVISTGVIVILSVKDKQQNNTKTTTSTQNLSQGTLKNLANSDQTVGTAKQTLNVESNAIFNGTVLVRNDLEVAGTIKVSGSLALPGITVSGISNFNQVQAATINTSGPTTVNGVLTAKNGLAVTGNASFNGNLSATQVTTTTLQLNGNLSLTHHITAGGAIPALSQGIALGSGGTASLSGSDTSGSITINTGTAAAGGCFVTIKFNQAFSTTPHVVVSPIGAAAAGLPYYINRSTSSFSVCTATPAPDGQTFGFDYMIFD